MFTFYVIVGFYLTSNCYVFCAPPERPNKEIKLEPTKKACELKDLFATCHLVPDIGQPNDIKGTVYFMQEVTSDCRYDFLSVQINVENLPKNNKTKMHGVHVHEFGDMRNGCKSMGGHYNPYGATHGSPWHPLNSRHVGDFGNHHRNDRGYFGTIKTRHVDYLAKLYGQETIMGRGLVVHAGKDDLGMKPNDPESLKTGNAGSRLACCFIGQGGPIDKSKFSLYGK